MTRKFGAVGRDPTAQPPMSRIAAPIMRKAANLNSHPDILFILFAVTNLSLAGSIVHVFSVSGTAEDLSLDSTRMRCGKTTLFIVGAVCLS